MYKKRNELGIKRVYKLVDTCAGEFPAKTPYYYSTFEEENESIRSDRKKIVVLGSGPNRIGQGIEFDYSCVHGVLAAKEMGYETIMINCNPETVSTDFDTADKLYFEPVFWEHIYDIIQHEQPEGVDRAARRTDRAEARRETGEVRHQDHRHQLRRAGHGRGPRALHIAPARPRHPVSRLRCA